mmetsp:Transcript_26301/g.37692  ORF Transcript_26301/g.37692 Transcript_26301/m.37692 type:complete len:373 (+) Transcript_26301:320-1438(+)|eukprot:CAMPEP_0172420664 /NCGR_PEP_ID=MMETSP1064-20121228/7016_1 /TAXON_ID=202472 /ORGANISM="Aulacoseira subarctica , Strain CCAP 1002/5" /LENGTH=372 /DNA_ID=CAMNT_0013160725 /DNA_START=294 /DNA_END=1412 /DNA_ORIENTATION=-
MPKVIKDPGAPKRNMSAYLLYQNAMREQFKAINPGMTFGQLSKYTSAMYAELTVAEKESWQARAEADKARYLRELAGYQPPPGYDSKGDAIASTTNHYPMPPPGIKYTPSAIPSPAVKRTKSNKDQGAPKRNISAYLLYQNAMRDHFKAENPGMTFGQLSKFTSHMYKNLSPEERAIWDERSRQDKERYKAQMSAYVPPPNYDGRGNPVQPQVSKSSRGSRHAAPKDPNAPKRARGSFVCFTFDMRPKIMEEYPGIKFVEMGAILGERWRNLSPEEKKKYEDVAAQDKARFHAEMQQYQQAQQEQAQNPIQHHQAPYADANHHYYHDPSQAQYAAPPHSSFEAHQQHYQGYEPSQYEQQSYPYDPNAYHAQM